jgi:hypothetical protein
MFTYTFSFVIEVDASEDKEAFENLQKKLNGDYREDVMDAGMWWMEDMTDKEEE